ncbi:hypothetical protein BDV96DRAFT_684028 [Lophiotrema nucula]|uniref:Uncharacterized protein n=1 Tax=Lophiotrema nucula TaxID=690887 RepID=A0A6A5ZJ27_9PLEO|nr:hypothetical protein BDV96DRAFT_684028 [Lophiotrema nucula]
MPRLPKRHGGPSSYPSPATPTATLPAPLSTPELHNEPPHTFAQTAHGACTHLTTEVYDEKYATNISGMTDICEDTDMRGWSDGLFAELPQEANAFESAFGGDPNISAGFANLESDTDNLTTCSFLAPEELAMAPDPASMRASPENLALATDWVEELSKISAQLFAFDSDGCPPPLSTEDDTTQVLSRVEHSFALATNLSPLMKHFHTNLRDAPQAESSRKARSTATSSLIYHTGSSNPERERSKTLQDQSNSLLLMSSYLRLQSIFSSHLEGLDSYLESISASVGAEVSVYPASNITGRPDQPIAQRFMVVSMIEFHLRRIGEALRSSVKRNNIGDGYEAEEEPHDHNTPRGNLEYKSLIGVDIVLPVIYEEQAILLRMVSRMRARLVAARGL